MLFLRNVSGNMPWEVHFGARGRTLRPHPPLCFYLTQNILNNHFFEISDSFGQFSFVKWHRFEWGLYKHFLEIPIQFTSLSDENRSNDICPGFLNKCLLHGVQSSSLWIRSCKNRDTLTISQLWPWDVRIIKINGSKGARDACPILFKFMQFSGNKWPKCSLASSPW